MLETLGTPNSSLGILNLPRYLVPGSLSRLHLLRDPPIQGFQEVDMPQPTWGFYLQEVVTPQPAWGFAPWPEDASLSGCNSTG